MQQFGRLVATVVVLALGCAVLMPAPATAGTPPRSRSQQAADITNIVEDAIASNFLQSVIVKVTKGDQVVIREAFGESMTDVPATPKMHFRNGAIAFAYLGNLLMQYVDEKRVGLDDTIDRWMPELPEADTVTLKMLANQTTGYPDYEQDPVFVDAFTADPFHIFTFEERLDIAFARPVLFPPGTNWSYAHTNFMILGEVLSMIGEKPLDVLLREKVLEPMGLRDTVSTETSAIPSPVLHTFGADRGTYEEATFWNTQWGTPIGANQTSTIDDLITTAVAIGTGELLSKSSYKAMTDSNLLGLPCVSTPQCGPPGSTQSEFYNFGLGVVRQGPWILQRPLLSGIGVTEAYLPSQKIAIAVAVTLKPEAFDPEANIPSNPGLALFEAIAAYMAANDAPPAQPGGS